MIKITNLTKTFKLKKALNNFNLEVGQQEVVGILGPNGSGKSTLMRIAAGLIPVSKGSLTIDDLQPGSESKANVSYLSEVNAIPHGDTVIDVMEFYSLFFEDFNKEQFLLSLESLKLDKEMKTKVRKLSKGMQQKLRLALTMARNAKIYLLDEPLGGIDPLAREEILDTLIDSMNEDSTMIITTHLVSEIEHIITRVVYINEGQVLGDYECEKLRMDEGVSIEEKYKEVFKNV
jgi:ABC-2 type transport system ATP-binding protein